jgi:hypothetical protein
MWRAAKLPPAKIRPTRVGEHIHRVRAVVQAVRHSSHRSALVIVALALVLGGAAFTAWAAYGPDERLGAPPIFPDISKVPPPPPPPPPIYRRVHS